MEEEALDPLSDLIRGIFAALRGSNQIPSFRDLGLDAVLIPLATSENGTTPKGNLVYGSFSVVTIGADWTITMGDPDETASAKYGPDISAVCLLGSNSDYQRAKRLKDTLIKGGALKHAALSYGEGRLRIVYHGAGGKPNRFGHMMETALRDNITGIRVERVTLEEGIEAGNVTLPPEWTKDEFSIYQATAPLTNVLKQVLEKRGQEILSGRV